jgi:TolB protein
MRGGLREEDKFAGLHHARAAIEAGADDAATLAIAGVCIGLIAQVRTADGVIPTGRPVRRPSRRMASITTLKFPSALLGGGAHGMVGDSHRVMRGVSRGRDTAMKHIRAPSNNMRLFLSGIGAFLLITANVHAASNGVIAYSCRDTSGHQNICYIHPDGTGNVQITFNQTGGAGLPSWAPSGNALAYVDYNMTTGLTYINTMNSDGSNVQSLVQGNTPMWSPDGNWLAFTAPSSTGTPEIFIIAPDGSGLTQLTNAPGSVKIHPTWSPDGQSIAYSQYDPATGHISVWGMTSTGANRNQITTGTWNNVDARGKFVNTANDAGSADWNPTSNKIVFWSGVEGQYGEVWSINSDSTGRTQLTKTGKNINNDDPEWSPDGKKIVFSTNRSGITEMWVMNSDGSNAHKIVNNTSNPLPGDAAWQPLP